MKKITVLIAFIYSFISHAIAVPEITVQNLGQYTGKYLSLYYVSGSKGGLGVKGQELNVNMVLAGPITQKVTTSELTFPSIEVKVNGFAAFNFVVAVIHDQAEHFITNQKLVNNNITRVPVSTASTVVLDNQINRKFVKKKHRSYFNLKRDPKISL